MRVGDVVVMTSIHHIDRHFFSVGDRAKLIEHCVDELYPDYQNYFLADFNDLGNETVTGDGIWWVNGAYSTVEPVEEPKQ